MVSLRGALIAALVVPGNACHELLGFSSGREGLTLSLREHGIEPAASAELLDSGEFDWNALASAARAKRFGAAGPKDHKDRARQGRFLEYRGFEMSQIRRALDIRDDSD